MARLNLVPLSEETKKRLQGTFVSLQTGRRRTADAARDDSAAPQTESSNEAAPTTTPRGAREDAGEPHREDQV